MLVRWVSAMSFTVLLAGSTACVDDEAAGQDDLEAKELKKDGVAPTAAEIANALSAKGALGMSPRANDAGATEASAEVEVLPLEMSESNEPMIGALTQPIVKEMLEG